MTVSLLRKSVQRKVSISKPSLPKHFTFAGETAKLRRERSMYARLVKVIVKNKWTQQLEDVWVQNQLVIRAGKTIKGPGDQPVARPGPSQLELLLTVTTQSIRPKFRVQRSALNAMYGVPISP
jgi:hypothetical protein